MSASGDNPRFPPVLIRTALWYVALGAAWWALRDYLPSSFVAVVGDSPNSASVLPTRASGTVAGPASIPTLVAMITAMLTALPVTWVYILTRHKRGYQQSVVQTFLILPVIVAGIVALVQHSLALAFSLAGIVAAVRFRTNLDDSKDAANIFVVTGIGLAAAVDPPVALVISLTYNLLIIALWYTDFGRAPALEGRQAEQRLKKAMAVSNRTGMFVAQLDEQVLEELAPEQLDALAERAWRRRKRNGDELTDAEFLKSATLVRISTNDLETTRVACEKEFDDLFTTWKYMGKSKSPTGSKVLEYGVSFGETVTPGVVSDRLRGLPSGGVLGVEFRR